MPTINKASDGHRFIRRGFSGQDEGLLACETYQIGPKGDQVCDYLRVQNGEQFDMSLVYAFLLDGGAFNPNTPSNVSVYDLPQRYHPSEFVYPGEWTSVDRQLATIPRLSLMIVIEIFDALGRALKKDWPPKKIVDLAVMFYLSAKKREESDRMLDQL